MGFPGSVLYMDPYLTDNVAAIEGPELARRFPPPMKPGEVGDADWIAITHIHLDHCDLESLVPMSVASPRSRFVCPNECGKALLAAGIARERIVTAPENWLQLGDSLSLIAIPAAHPLVERDDEGFLRFVGYVLESAGRRFYHAGDTSPSREVIDAVAALSPIDTAFIPVNERNFYREMRGIIGNMTVREAFQLAGDLGVRTLVPTHWDMFAPNSVYREEIELLYRLMKPAFGMRIYPDEV
jgi:L-ascorbate metabolism protein UlaG (beta-lactamase superfamily)